MITDHVFRRWNSGPRPLRVDPGACAYMNCGRPRSEHAQAAWRGDVVQQGIAAREARS